MGHVTAFRTHALFSGVKEQNDNAGLHRNPVVTRPSDPSPEYCIEKVCVCAPSGHAVATF